MTAPLTGSAAGTRGLQRIDEITAPPVVGRRYLVPTVTYPWHGREEAWPVMGPKHTDAEHLRFDRPHYHVDVRFLSSRQARFEASRNFGGEATDEVARSPLSYGLPWDLVAHPEVVYRGLLCRRADHDFPIHLTLGAATYQALHTAFAGRRCVRNAAGLLICPHKGFALDTLVPDAQGRVVCPLHGLVIDVAAGVVVEVASPPSSSS